MATIKRKPVLSSKKKSNSKVSGNSIECEDVLLYRDGLDALEKNRYVDKLTVIHGQDPYDIVLWSTDENVLPAVTYIDIINYLIFNSSPYTREELRCYKGLDAYNQFVSGFVSDVGSCIINDKSVVTAKFLHSQRLNEKSLRPWIIAERDGPIIAGHCTCMAGLGETCTHVASLLFCIEAVVKLRESRTVTELPRTFNHVSYAQLKEIDFTSAATLKRKFDTSVDISQESATQPQLSTRKMKNPPSADRVQAFFQNLAQSKSNPAILSLLPEFPDNYVPEILQCELPKILTELREESAYDLEYNELLAKCSDLEVSVSPAQATHVEAITREGSVQEG
ncbi:hypothetical protein MAR_000674 [Mya arenaria]|uniref:SWIM-type domain-containing protein n=1 Tax=Mya arenaria TaxID=6604 RepID=A0ABY7FHW5_MYAAR|nr:hypothetical protein MAR_000674 [Mya arenaria]